MKKFLFIPVIFVAYYAQASVTINGKCYEYLWNPYTGTNQYVNCAVSSSTLPSGSTQYIQNTLTPTTATQVFNVQLGSVTGTLGVGNQINVSSITTEKTELILEQTGDAFGPSRLHIQNRNGSSGALFEGGGGNDLVDFGFKTPGAVQRNLRLENRGFATYINTPEFQIGNFNVGGNLFLVAANGAGVMTYTDPNSYFFIRPTASDVSKQKMADWRSSWSDQTDATRKGYLEGYVYDYNSAKRFLRVDADGTNPYTMIFGSATFVSPIISTCSFYTTTSSRPWVSSCGTTPSIASYSTNQSGLITVGGGVTGSCTLNFGTPVWINPPACTFTSNTAIASGTGSSTVSAFTFGGTSITSDVVMYQCAGSF